MTKQPKIPAPPNKSTAEILAAETETESSVENVSTADILITGNEIPIDDLAQVNQAQ